MVHYEIHPVDPQRRYLQHATDLLRNPGGICVYPTDTVYGMGACVTNARAIDRIGKLLQKDKKRLFSFICSDFSQMSKYVRIDNWQFKILKRYLPGPFTFILPATHYVPKKVCPKRKTVGVRMPYCRVVQALVELLGEPLANTSLSVPGEDRGDPELILPAVEHEVDIMLDIGRLDEPINSTLIDLTGDEPEVLREGKGEWEE